MISRHRLRGRRRFAAVRAAGVRGYSAGVRVQVSRNGLGVGRVGFGLVGLRSSVERNLLRRRLRAAVQPELENLAGHDAVIVAGAEALGLPFAELRSAALTALWRALERAGSATVASTADNEPVTRPPTAQR